LRNQDCQSSNKKVGMQRQKLDVGRTGNKSKIYQKFTYCSLIADAKALS
jgi:hypothetical protein